MKKSISEVRSNLINRKKKTITREALKELTKCFAEEELFNWIIDLQEEGILSPIRNSGTNGNRRYPLYEKYRIKTIQDDYSEELSLLRQLHPMLLQNGYLQNHPENYREFKSEIEAVSTFLFSKGADLVSISRKERSFQIFKEEKMLDSGEKGGRFVSLLGKIGIGKQELNFYDTPSYCFPDYIPEKKSELTILICENKDIWFNIRRVMFENRVYDIFGVHIDGVLLGNGYQITEGEALTEYSSFLGVDRIKYFYWGDIDRAGFDIYKQTMKANPSLEISLFISGYEKMLSLALEKGLETLPDSDDNRGHEVFEDIITLFSGENAVALSTCLQANKRLPQEIVSYAVLREY